MGDFTDKLKDAANDVKDTFTNEDNADPRDDRANRNGSLINDNDRIDANAEQRTDGYVQGGQKYGQERSEDRIFGDDREKERQTDRW